MTLIPTPVSSLATSRRSLAVSVAMEMGCSGQGEDTECRCQSLWSGEKKKQGLLGETLDEVQKLRTLTKAFIVARRRRRGREGASDLFAAEGG